MARRSQSPVAPKTKSEEHPIDDPNDRAVDNWERLGWGGGDHLRAALAITRVAAILNETSTATLRPAGLTPARHELLSLLCFSKRGELPLSRLSKLLMVHPKSVTTTVDSLERIGYLERRPHPTDRRATLAVITQEGRDAMEIASPAISESLAGLAEITEEEASLVTEILRKVRMAHGDF